VSPQRKKVIIGVSGVLIVTILAVGIYLHHLITKSFPQTTGTISVRSIKADVKVYRDENGVPHIFAENEQDLMFAAGYVTAQDRLWQMDVTRRYGQGRLAEVFGKDVYAIDVMTRTIGFNRIARQIEGGLHPESRQTLQAYADGVNYYIETHRKELPIEFDMLGYEPEPWKVEHSLIITRLMGWELNISWWVDITMGELVEKLGEQKVSELYPVYPDNAPLIVPHTISSERLSHIGNDFLEVAKFARRFFGTEGTQIGSNSWAVTGSKSLSGKPILANDPHLIFQQPAKWYEMHLVGGRYDVAGVALPGTPGVVIGHNQSIAWGLTHSMADECDLYIEEIDSLDNTKYLYNGEKRDFKVITENVFVKDSGNIPVTVRLTHRGPIISNIHPLKYIGKEISEIRPDTSLGNTAMSIRWTGFEFSDENYAFYLINRAKNWEEFKQGMREFAVPGQNFIYADTAGNIGYWYAVKLPKRKGKNPCLPFPGWTDEYEWQGFVPFDELPHTYNPPEEFIATANNKPVGDSYPYYLSNLWEPPARITRIREMMEERERLSVEDFKQMQMDYLSTDARENVPFILHAHPDSSVYGNDTRTALVYLRNWDFVFKKEDIATTIYNAFMLNLMRNTFADEMGEELFQKYIFLSSMVNRAVTDLLKRDHSTWFDNVKTEQAETRDDIIRESLKDAMGQLKQQLGNETKNWRWGNLHTVTFQHPFGRGGVLDKVFNVGPFPVGGATTTVNNAEFSYIRPYRNTLGPSMRQIVDLADIDTSLIVITTGQSGQPFFKHYDDQVQLWLNGGYIKMVTNRRAIEGSGWNVMVMRATN
jgi:penicillin amidase